MTQSIKNPFFSDPSQVIRGNDLRILLFGDEIREQILSLIHSAKYRVYIVMYEFKSDEAGKSILNALIEARRRGCEVKIVYDAVGSFFTSASFFEPLQKIGGEVYVYHSFWPFKFDLKFTKRNHRKIICVDGEYAVLGGFNFSDLYFKAPEKGGCFDVGVLIHGRASAQAYEYFDHSLQRSEGKRFEFGKRSFFENRRKVRMTSEHDSHVQVVGNDHFVDRWRIRRELLFALSKAKRSIRIMNPYFLPDPVMIRSLVSVVENGIDVKILVPSYTDVMAVDLASSVVFQRLCAHGIKIRKWPGFLHGKALIIDDQWFSIGSFNLDYRSLFHNLEVVVNAFDPEVAKGFATRFDLEFDRSKQVDLTDWKNMPLVAKLFASLIYRLRAFL